jgi:methylmalonyl-CoA mutase C-terminal domain/subunit
LSPLVVKFLQKWQRNCSYSGCQVHGCRGNPKFAGQAHRLPLQQLNREQFLAFGVSGLGGVKLNNQKHLRVLLAKPGLDGHDKGAKIVASLLRDAGIEVIYTGLKQTIGQIVTAAIQEDVDVIALSVLSGAHVELSRSLMTRLREEGVDKIPVVMGGVIPLQDVEELEEIGIARVFPVESSLDSIAEYFTGRGWEAGKNEK